MGPTKRDYRIYCPFIYIILLFSLLKYYILIIINNIIIFFCSRQLEVSKIIQSRKILYSLFLYNYLVSLISYSAHNKD